MQFLENISLAEYTTFKIGGRARFFCAVKSEEDLVEAVKFAKKKKLPILVLGGGSNVLISDDGFKGLTIKMEIMGLGMTGGPGADPSEEASISACAGELWDSLVERSVHWGFYGLENLSAIPGTVGAAPIQNIGAYGAEAAQTIEGVRVLDTKIMEFVVFSKEDCRFAYRDSIFKHERGRYIVTSVYFKLSKNGVLHTDYKDVTEYLFARKITQPTLQDLRQAIVEIRANKLPDWNKWGTAGSFFKNPSIPAAQYEDLKKQYPDLPGYPEDDGNVKVSLGWILDKVCDARGLTFGNVGTYGKQALVLVSKPGAKAKDVVALSQELMKRVKDKTGITIEAEVEWVC
jgi:UDP-N-acetylmuramate dehydrogenase